MVIDALGFGNVTSLAAVSGLEGEGFVSRTLLGIDGDPTGVLWTRSRNDGCADQHQGIRQEGGTR